MAAKQLQENRVQAMVTMLVIVFALTMGLFYLWKVRTMPTQVIAVKDELQLPSRPATPTADTPSAACERVGGTWADCGSPCHGSPPGTVCAQVCEPQCLCGGKNGSSCPTNQTCQQKDADGVGVCRTGVVPSVPVVEVPKSPSAAPAGMFCDTTNSICLSAAVSGTTLLNPFTVTGTAIAFENTVNWRLLDAKGTELSKGFMTTNAPDVGKPGDFALEQFLFDVPATKTGFLEVFESSAKDGAPIHVVRVPVRFPKTTQVSDLYWLTRSEASDMGAYEEGKGSSTSSFKVMPFTVLKSAKPIEAYVRLFFTKKAADDSGYISYCAGYGCQVKDVVLSDGVLTISFDHLPNGDPFPSQDIRTPLVLGLKKFPSVKSVVIKALAETGQELLTF